MTSSSTVELLSVAVVREYLSRKGYKSTLIAFDNESKKKDDSIQNRKKLAEELKILDLVKENKSSSDDRLKCFLDIIVKYFKERKHKRSSKKHGKSSSYILKQGKSSSHVMLSRTDIETSNSADSSEHCPTCSCNGAVSWRKKYHKNNTTNVSIATVTTKTTQNDSSGVTLEVKASSSLEVIKPSSFIEEHLRNKGYISPHQGSNNGGELIVDDVEYDFDNDGEVGIVDENTATNSDEQLHLRVEEMSSHMAIELRKLLFGSIGQTFNSEWSRQGFYFSDHPLLTYGLVQEKGGPCGLLAAVQAWILKKLLVVEGDTYRLKNTVPRPTPAEQTDALVTALTDILWLVHSNDEATITLPSSVSRFNCPSKFKVDHLIDKLDLFKFNDKAKMQRFIRSNIPVFGAKNGIILFLYSTVLSCGIETIKNHMDVVGANLLGNHGYCTQEMVNLMLTGKAVSNTFNGETELGSGEQKTILRGIEKPSHIGFLSLFEYYNSSEVGSYYKNPTFPIYVVYSESHFSILFAIRHIAETTLPLNFDLYYYDGLGKQDEEIRLSVSTGERKMIKTTKVGKTLDLVSPVDCCIQTKWKNAVISWNGVEPLL